MLFCSRVAPLPLRCLALGSDDYVDLGNERPEGEEPPSGLEVQVSKV